MQQNTDRSSRGGEGGTVGKVQSARYKEKKKTDKSSKTTITTTPTPTPTPTTAPLTPLVTEHTVPPSVDVSEERNDTVSFPPSVFGETTNLSVTAPLLHQSSPHEPPAKIEPKTESRASIQSAGKSLQLTPIDALGVTPLSPTPTNAPTPSIGTLLTVTPNTNDTTTTTSSGAVCFKASDLGPLIRINVGGERFSTSRKTIVSCPHEKDHVLQIMFESEHELPRDDKGCVFIDRDPKYFRHLLNWLRNAQLPLLGDVAKACLLKEAQFFQLKALVRELSSETTVTGTHEGPHDLSADQLQLILAIAKMKLAHVPVNLSGLNLNGLRLVGLEMKGSWFYETNLQSTQFCYSSLTQSKFIKANLEGADFSFADLTSANFSHANLKGVLFRYAKLSNVVMSNSDLTGVDFSNQTLGNINFQGANLTKANLSGTTISGANFSGAILTGANLSGSNFQGADFSQATLKYTNLSKCNLQGAKLCGSNFSMATINGAVFADADFTGARLPEDFNKVKNKCVLTGTKGL